MNKKTHTDKRGWHTSRIIKSIIDRLSWSYSKWRPTQHFTEQIWVYV